MSLQIDHIDADAIEAMLPHGGKMSLLSRVAEISDERIVTESTSHLEDDNPLRSADRLPVSAGIEYAAQTVALHSALNGKDGGTPRRGYLAVLSNVSWHTERLDNVTLPLIAEARQLVSTENSSQYSFTVSAGETALLEGSFVVSLEPL